MAQEPPSSLVLELQRLASTNTSEITELVRKAFLVARKLQLQDFAQWANNELNGYGNSEVPTYRERRALIMGIDRHRGYIDAVIPDKSLEDAMTRVSIRDSISQLTQLLGQGTNTTLVIPFSGEITKQLMDQQGIGAVPLTRVVDRSHLAAIIDAVRSQILAWSLRLEEEGILGAGMTFSEKEQEKAATTFHITNFQGHLGDVHGGSSTHSFHGDIKQNDLESLSAFLKSKGIAEADLQELTEAIRSDPRPTDHQFGKSTSAWIGKMITKAASGAWQVGVGAAGTLLAEAICAYHGLPRN